MIFPWQENRKVLFTEEMLNGVDYEGGAVTWCQETEAQQKWKCAIMAFKENSKLNEG